MDLLFLRLSSTKTSGDSFTDDVFYSAAGGENGFPFYRAIHTRKR